MCSAIENIGYERIDIKFNKMDQELRGTEPALGSFEYVRQGISRSCKIVVNIRPKIGYLARQNTPIQC